MPNKDHGLDTFDVEGAWSNEDRADKTRSQGGEPCVVCGRRVSSGALQVHFVQGGSEALAKHEEEAYELEGLNNNGGDMGWWSIGSDCAKNIPAKYLTKIN